jgi:hypothetical protein
MSNRLFAAFLVSLFILSVALIAVPVSAHTTLGRLTGTPPEYRIRDSEVNPNHVPGPISYVWPGGGKDWWTGSIPAYTGEPPGYQSPWGRYPANPPTSTWWQLRGNAYAPFGAIITSMEDHENVGDLVFAIKFWPYDVAPGTPDGGVAHTFDKDEYRYWSVYIYVPPEFDLSNSNVYATFEGGAGDPCAICEGFERDPSTDQHIADVRDPFGPGWWILRVPGPLVFNVNTDIDGDGAGYDETYYVRLNNVVAPKIAGRYVFKIFMNDTFPLANVAAADGTINPNLPEGDIGGIMTSTMPVENWPIILVKGEIDPGIAEGTIRFGTWDINLVEQPLTLPGRVRFVGEAYDPYSWTPTGREVEARGYFNASAIGHWEVEGIAPGVYDVYASAAGYPEELQYTGVEVHMGKSIHLDLKLNPGIIVHGRIYAKHGFGDVDWWGELPVLVEIYDSNEWPAAKPGYDWGETEGATPDDWRMWEMEHLLSWSPQNQTDAPYTSYVNGPQAIWDNGIFDGASARFGPGVLALDDENDNGQGAVTPRSVAFPWDGVPGVGPWGLANKDPLGVHNGVGPDQIWFTDPTTSIFEFQFGNKIYGAGDATSDFGLYGCPTEYSGHIPQVFASWINGLVPGTYYARAWVNGYVQTDASGSYVDYMFTVAEKEWAGDIDIPMDLQLNGYIEKEVHFQRLPGILVEQPIGGPDPWRFLIAEARDEQGTLVALNFTQVYADETNAVIQLRGFGMAGPVLEDNWESNGFLEPNQAQPWTWHSDEQPDEPATVGDWNVGQLEAHGMHFSLTKYRGIRDYGMMPGTYKIYVYMRGYVQQEFEMASVSLSGDVTYISNHMYLGAGINFTLYSIDWQHPRINRNWAYDIANLDGKPVTVEVFSSNEVKMGEVRYWNGENWAKPAQDAAYNTIPNAGWDTEWSKLKFNGSQYLERAGPDETIGVWTPHPNDEQGTLWYSTIRWGSGFLPNPGAYRDADFKTVVALETDTYSFNVLTLGYFFKDADKYTLYAAKGTQADTKLNVMIGIWFNYTLIFKKEGLLDATPFDMAIQLAFYDENGNYVAGGYPYSPRGTTQVSGVTFGERNGGDVYVGIPCCITTNPDSYCGEYTMEVKTFVFPHGYDQTGGWLWDEFDWYPPPAVLLGQYGDDRPGPYELRTEITIPVTHCYGGQSIVFELDQRPLLTGQIAGFSWSDELRTISWATVSVSGAAGEFAIHSFDGVYELFVPRGDYDMTITYYDGDMGFTSQTISITAPDGGSVTSNFLNMERSNIPIPEFPVSVIVAFTALAASLYVFRRARKN